MSLLNSIVNVAKALEDALSQVHHIKGYLKIHRSYPLVSLSFLRNLRRVDGNGVSNERGKDHIISVMDNQNLQDLFEPNREFKLGPGKIAFHYNPKLCFFKIEAFKARLGPKAQYDSIEATKTSNGDKIACNVAPLNVTILRRANTFAIIRWEKFETEDERSLLAYVVYHIEAPHQNVSLYDGRDACGSDGWEIEDVSVSDTVHPMFDLKPFTQYAYYVKTVLISSETYGAQSDIQYFTTASGEPMPINKLITSSNHSSEIVSTLFIFSIFFFKYGIFWSAESIPGVRLEV